MSIASGEYSRLDNLVKAGDFRGFVRRQLFPRSDYDMLRKSPGRSEPLGDHDKRARDPDIQFRTRNRGRPFWVEATYRSSFKHNDMVEWCHLDQFLRYKDFDNAAPVLLALGMGPDPTHPGPVFLAPVRQLEFHRLFHSYLRRYEIRPDRPVTDVLLSRLVSR